MSMEIHVLSDKALSSVADWQQAIDAEGFKVKLDATVKFDTASGFVPALLHDKKSGFECFHDDVGELIETYADNPELDFGHVWKHALSFRLGSLAHEGISAFMAATAYAQATGGVVFDPQDGRIMTPSDSRELVSRWEKLEFPSL